MEPLGIITSFHVVLARSPPKGIVSWLRTPMERRANRVAAVRVILRGVATRFSNIDFSTHGPRAVRRRIWHHPNGGPKPVTLRHFRDHLDSPVLQSLLALRGKTGAPDRVDYGTGSIVATDRTHGVVVGRASPCLGKVQNVAIEDLVRCDICGLGCESRNDMQAIRICVCILWVGCCPIKRSSTKSSGLQLEVPDAVVNLMEVVLKGEAKGSSRYAHVSV